MVIEDFQALFWRALKAHRDGDLAAAAAGYRDVLAANPGHVDATHYLGMVAYQQGETARALELVGNAARSRPEDSAVLANFGLVLLAAGQAREASLVLDQSLKIRPEQPDALLNLALAHSALGHYDKAAACYGRVLELIPGHAAARLSLAQIMLNARRPSEAREVLERGLALDRGNPDLRLALGQSLELADDLEGAAECYRQVAEQHSDHRSRALTRLSGALRKQHRPGSALMAARVAAWSEATDDAAWRAVGQALKELGWLHPAAEAFRRSHELLRSPGGPDSELPTFSRTSRAKLRHDIEQIEYLDSQGLADKSLHSVAKNLRLVMEGMPDSLPDGKSVTLPTPVRRRLRGIYNRCHRYRETPELAGAAVNTELVADQIAADYRSRPPGLTWIDGFLTAEALESLRRFCLESTIWYDFEHRNGYVGAYLQDGFDCPLLLQIAEELPRSLPEIFGDHVLMQLWAYKYDSRLEGIDMHADFAAVNVNFWITPDEANRDPESGGMVIWDREAPPEWGVDEYNTYDPAQQRRILDYLEEEGATRITVPYRENRCVIFDSDLFHKTDDIHFGDRYEDRRINVTMLYGTRGGARGRRHPGVGTP